MKSWGRVLLVSTCLVGVGCQDEHLVSTQAYYYPNGGIRAKVSSKGAVEHGPVTVYYPNGQLKHYSEWVDGKKHGTQRSYYTNGALQDSCTYVAGKIHGLFWQYYRNRGVKAIIPFNHGVPEGIASDYDSLGTRTERQTFDAQGRLIYIVSYDAQGKPNNNGMLCGMLEVRDTISHGQNVTGSLHFGYPLTCPATLLLGQLKEKKKGVDPLSFRDTLQVVTAGRDGYFRFSLSLPHVGAYRLGYKWLQPCSPSRFAPQQDSLSVNGDGGEFHILVQ